MRFVKNIKRKVISAITMSFMICNFCTGITTYANDSLPSRQNVNVLDSNRIINEDEYIRILVQLDGDAVVDKSNNLDEASYLEENIKNSQAGIINKVEEITGNKVRKSYGYLVNGFSIEGKRKDIPEIRKIKGVKSVEESIKMQSKMTTSNVITEAESLWTDYKYKGEGMVISVIDTGFDYTHKDFKNIDSNTIKITEESANNDILTLGHGKYFSDKIPYGYNYSDGNDDIKNEEQTHGMHVAGIALANGAIKGVAPEAQLLAMRVADTNGQFYNEDIIQAIEDSVKLGADVINMSFGTDGEYYGSNNLYKKAIEKAIQKGVICVNACGNAMTSSSSDASSKSIENLLDVKDTSTVDITSLDSFSVASMDNISDITDNFPENMSSFSSWGPSPDLELKPEITAPGGNITSTVYNNSYETESGTSMSAPNIAGGTALILQSLKSKGINFNENNVNNIVKCLMMNTAKVLTNNSTGIIYSPRQQGAGLIQLEQAVKNNVTATDSRGKAYIALKNISNNNVDFEIVLNNYGNSDATYSLSDESLYTEVCNNGKSVEEKIDGAKISFDKNEVTVKAGETSHISGSVSIPKNFSKQNFIEGYISLKSNDLNVPSISLPIIGFYGDYGDENIVDAPIYDNNSIVGVTGLGELSDDGKSFNYYGRLNSSSSSTYGTMNKSTSNIKVNSDNVAFSPNNDGIKDNVQLITYFLRNAKEYKVEILDKDKKLIGNRKEFNDEAKDLYSNYVNYSIAGLFNENYSWDGTYYDKFTGDNKVVSDGQYYVRITTCGYTENAKEQVMDLPVKVDTKVPEVKIEDISVASSRWGFGTSLCTVKWKASDDLSGMSREAYASINGNLSSMTPLNNITESNGEYSATLQVSRGVNIKNLTLNVTDNAGNKVLVTSGDNTIIQDDNTAPVITSISKYAEGSISYTSNSLINFTVTGQDESNVTCIVKNETLGITSTSQMNSKGQAVISMELTNGANLFSITLKDAYGNISQTKYFTVVYVKDLKSLSAGFTNVNGILKITDEKCVDNIFTINGYVTEKLHKVTINNDEVKVNSDLTFSYDLKLNQGLNKVILSIEDKDGNSTTESSARIYYDTVAPVLKLDKEIDVTQDSTLNTDNDKILVKGSVSDNSTEYYVFINGNQALSSDTNNMQIIDVKDSNLINREFIKEIELNEGLNVITIDAVDIYGNKTERIIKINKSNNTRNDDCDNTDNSKDPNLGNIDNQKQPDSSNNDNLKDPDLIDNDNTKNPQSGNSDIDKPQDSDVIDEYKDKPNNSSEEENNDQSNTDSQGKEDSNVIKDNNEDKIEDNTDVKAHNNDDNQNNNSSSNGQSNKTCDNSLNLLFIITIAGSIIVYRKIKA